MRNALSFLFSGGAVIVTICGVKLLRSAFSETGRQFPILVFTVLYFLFDYQTEEEDFMSADDDVKPMLLKYFVVYYFIMSIILTKVSSDSLLRNIISVNIVHLIYQVVIL